MNRMDFEALRDLPGKRIVDDVHFAQQKATSPLRVCENIRVENTQGVDVRMTLSYNPETGSKTVNVHVQGVGPICRLDVDGSVHRPCGRSHKHALQGDRCPDRNLPEEVVDRPDLAGTSTREVFGAFLEMAHIIHEGAFHAPDEAGGGT